MHIQCLHACTVQLWPWTQNIHCKACWQLKPFHLWMSVPTGYLLSMVRHDDSVLLVALYGTPMDFCLPWRTNILMVRRLCFMDFHVWMKLSVLWYLCLKYMWTSAQVPLYDWNIASTWHMISQLYTPFPILPRCWPQISCHDLWKTHMYVCKYMSTHVCLHVCISHAPGLYLDRFWITFCLQLWVPNPQHGTVHGLSSSALQYFNSSLLGMPCLHLLSYVDSLTHLTRTDYA